MPDNRDLDELLDRALASYAHTEPDPSLRARITSAAEAAPHHQWTYWAFAGGAAWAAALALTLFVLRPQFQTTAPEIANAARHAAPSTPARALQQMPPAVEHAHTVRTTHHVSRAESATLERSRFHASDDALTEEDRILLKFIAEHPKEASQILTPPPAQPVEIKPITIAPIEIADLSNFGQSKDPNQHFEK